MPSPRIRQLLTDRADILADLAEAKTADEAASYRADLHANSHSLFLAGHRPEDETING